MSERSRAVRVDATGPSYPAWNAPLLAELALVRVFEFTVHRRSAGPDGPPYEFLVTGAGGTSFFVWVKGFSSYYLGLKEAAVVPELGWAVGADVVRKARQSSAPLILFLY